MSANVGIQSALDESYDDSPFAIPPTITKKVYIKTKNQIPHHKSNSERKLEISAQARKTQLSNLNCLFKIDPEINQITEECRLSLEAIQNAESIIPESTRNQNEGILMPNKEYSFEFLEAKKRMTLPNSYSARILQMKNGKGELGELKNKCFNSMQVTKVKCIENDNFLPALKPKKRVEKKEKMIGFAGCKILHRRFCSMSGNKYAYKLSQIKVNNLPSICVKT